MFAPVRDLRRVEQVAGAVAGEEEDRQPGPVGFDDRVAGPAEGRVDLVPRAPRVCRGASPRPAPSRQSGRFESRPYRPSVGAGGRKVKRTPPEKCCRGYFESHDVDCGAARLDVFVHREVGQRCHRAVLCHSANGGCRIKLTRSGIAFSMSRLTTTRNRRRPFASSETTAPDPSVFNELTGAAGTSNAGAGRNRHAGMPDRHHLRPHEHAAQRLEFPVHLSTWS